jgi:hypothetical protein
MSREWHEAVKKIRNKTETERLMEEIEESGEELTRKRELYEENKATQSTNL